MGENFKANFMIKVDSVHSMDYFTGRTIYTNNVKEIIDVIKSYYEKENERIYRLSIAFNSETNYNVNTVVLIENYKLIPENFYRREEFENEYKELLMIEKLKRR